MSGTECPYAQRVCICIMISQSIISHLNSQSSVLVFEIAIVILPIFKKGKGNFEAINWISHRPIVRSCKNRLCWPKTKRLSSTSPAKMSLLGISRELQRRVCNHGKPPGSSRKPRARELFHRKEANFVWEDSGKQRVHDFSLAASSAGRERSPSSSCWALL